MPLRNKQILCRIKLRNISKLFHIFLKQFLFFFCEIASRYSFIIIQKNGSCCKIRVAAVQLQLVIVVHFFSIPEAIFNVQRIFLSFALSNDPCKDIHRMRRGKKKDLCQIRSLLSFASFRTTRRIKAFDPPAATTEQKMILYDQRLRRR